MYPVYNQFMDSYPSHHMNQNHDHPFPYQSWPHPGYGYYPGYFATPMPPYGPAPPMFYGGYPAPPMPYNMMERPCYSPRNMPESYGHCCGCPNHQQDHGRKDEEGSDSVKMAGGSPVVWIPPGLVKNAAEQKVKEKEKNPPGAEKERERSEPSEEEKSFLNRLIPLIMEASGSRNPDSPGFAMQGSDSKKENQDAEKREIPFPFLWMPCNLNDKSTEKKEKDAAEECRKETAPEKNSAPKVVPVKSVEESTDERLKSSSMKSVDGGKEDGKPASSPRSSRLPPVCLRVDPVNKKRNGKGSSRSPSPPGDENKLREVPRESSSKDAEQRETKAKAIDVSEGMTKKDEDKDQNSPKSQVQANEYGSNSRFADNMGGSEKVTVRRHLSEGEAATMIQSAYRGYEVRRWEPLKKLKQISEVRNEVVKLGNGISSDTVNDDKRRIAMDETIMSLLLKLDTIQGLHPSIRDVRKSVARELVSLQEKIDQLSQKKPDIAPDRESDEKLANDQGGQEKEELSEESTHRVNQEVSEGVSPADEKTGLALDNPLEILGVGKNDEKTGLASQQPVMESSEDANHGGTSEAELRLEAEEKNDVQEPFSEVGDIKPGNCESQEDKGERSMTDELLDGELPEGKIEGKNDASKGKDLTDEPQEILADGESPTKDVTEEPQKALVHGESWKDEGVIEDVAKEKDLAEQLLGVLDENVLKASSKAEVLDNILENCTNVSLESHEAPAEASQDVELDVKDMKEGHLSPPSPTSSLENGDSVSAELNKKLMEENEKLREMMQKLIETGNQQLSTISNLSGRLEDLEKKLGRKNRLKVRGKNHRPSRKACRKSMNETVLD